MSERSIPLADLVRERNDRWSYREMADRARRSGHSISHSQLADYASDSVRKVPTREQIEALAAALDVGQEAVRAAVFEQFYGYVPRELKRGRASRILAAVPPGLTQEEEDELLRLIEAWLTTRHRP